MLMMENQKSTKINKKLTGKKNRKPLNPKPDNQQYQLQFNQMKRLGLVLNKNKISVGNWTGEQNFVYLRFLVENKIKFHSEQQRRRQKVFYKLSKILKRRTPDQCRSHHQKLQMKHNDNIDEIIENIKRKLRKKNPQILLQNQKNNQVTKKQCQLTQQTKQISLAKDQQLKKNAFYSIATTDKAIRLTIELDHICQWH